MTPRICNTITNTESENATPCDSDTHVNNALDTSDIDSENTNSTVSEIVVGPGTRSYKTKYYLRKVRDLCACFNKVASRTLRMEQQNKPMEENIQFAQFINDVGCEHIEYGKNYS